LNRYEGLFILDAAAKEETLKEVTDRIQKEIEQAGGRVEKVQKMGQRPFARTTRKRGAGHYVNFVFEAQSKTISGLNAKFKLDTDIFRWQFALAPAELPARTARATKEPVVARE
jgi:ribosomal protein S6